MAVVVRAGRDYPPILWPGGWREWRTAQVCPDQVEFRDRPTAPRSNFCWTCSGQGVFLDPVRRPNRQVVGYQRRPCPTCDGEGRT